VESRTFGVADVIEARAVKQGRVDFRSAVYSALVSAVSFNAPIAGAMLAFEVVLGAPLSTTLIVFELTASADAAIAVLVAVSLATIVTQKVLGASYFQLQIERRGYELREGPQRVILKTVRVRDFMTPIDRLKKESVLEGPAPFEDDSLGRALGFLEAEGLDGAPVKARGSDAVTGCISRADALIAYNNRLVEAHVERARSREIKVWRRPPARCPRSREPASARR
jgi:hypothetical protein